MSLTPRKNKGLLTYIAIAAVIIIVLGVLIPNLEPAGQGKKYSEIMHEFDEYNVTEYTLNLKTGELEYVLEGSSDKNTYIVPNVNLFINDTDSEKADYRWHRPA